MTNTTCKSETDSLQNLQTSPRIALALGGLAGSNAWGAGFLAGMQVAGVRPTAIIVMGMGAGQQICC